MTCTNRAMLRGETSYCGIIFSQALHAAWPTAGMQKHRKIVLGDKPTKYSDGCSSPSPKRQLIVGLFWRRRRKKIPMFIEREVKTIVYLWSDWNYPCRQKHLLHLARFIFWHQMQSNNVRACSLKRRQALTEK